MGKSLKRIVFTIRNQFTSFIESDDSRLKKELVEDMILDVRAAIARDLFVADRFLGDDWYQVCDGIEIKSRKASMPSGISEIHPDIYSDIPALQSEIGWKNIKYLGSVDGRNNYSRLSYAGFLSTEGRLVTDNDPFYTVSGTNVMYKNLPNIGQKYVRMIAILYDPRKAQDFDDEIDFPMPDAQIHKCELICIRQLSSTLNIPTDIVNDAADAPIPQKNGRR